MTLNEFKAWLEGFEAGMGDNPPTAAQWATIKAKLDTVKQPASLIPSGVRQETPFRSSFGPLVGDANAA
jgi:hypothetical protein